MRARTTVAVVLVGAVGYLTSAAGGQTGGQPATKQLPPVAPKPPETTKPKLEPLDRTELDKRIARVVNAAIITGVNLWLDEKIDRDVRVEGTYRLYQGTLAAVVPLLDHRPELQKIAGYRLKQGSGQMPMQGAFVFREALDEIQKETAPALVVKPLWDRLGGEAAVRVIVKDFVEAASKDPKANLSRGGKYKLDEKELKELQDRVTEGLSYMVQGPQSALKWGGDDQPQVALLKLQLNASEYDALTANLIAAMKKNKVGTSEMGEVLKLVATFRTIVTGGR
jgi:hypothetical protein